MVQFCQFNKMLPNFTKLLFVVILIFESCKTECIMWISARAFQPTNIWLHKLASTQSRTSPLKFARSQCKYPRVPISKSLSMLLGLRIIRMRVELCQSNFLGELLEVCIVSFYIRPGILTEFEEGEVQD